MSVFVIPAQAGIYTMDARFRGHDNKGKDHE